MGGGGESIFWYALVPLLALLRDCGLSFVAIVVGVVLVF